MSGTTLGRSRRGPHRRRAAWLLAGAALAGAALRCDDDEYPIAPTLCDDWCLVTQRAGCDEDYPEGCVSDCEDEAIGRRLPRCEPAWRSLIECYRGAPASDFSCLEDESQPGLVCLEQRLALARCASPLAGQCLDVCLREARECDRYDLACEERCDLLLSPCDGEQRALYECQLAAPVDCVLPEEETRDLDEIPCLAEIGALLECAGFDAGARAR
jgi:hypothetical protein